MSPDMFWAHLQSVEAVIAEGNDTAGPVTSPRSPAEVESVSISDFAARFGGS